MKQIKFTGSLFRFLLYPLLIFKREKQAYARFSRPLLTDVALTRVPLLQCHRKDAVCSFVL